MNQTWNEPTHQSQSLSDVQVLISCPRAVLDLTARIESALRDVTLNLESESELDAILKRLAWELKMGVALIEHRLELLSAISDRVMVLDAGVSIADGPAEEVFELQVVRDAYFQDAA